MMLLGSLSLPLNELIERTLFAVSGGIIQFRGCVASPAWLERFWG